MTSSNPPTLPKLSLVLSLTKMMNLLFNLESRESWRVFLHYTYARACAPAREYALPP